MSDKLSQEQFDLLMKAITDRMNAVDNKITEQLGEARLADLVKTQLTGLVADETFVRKMRFGAKADAKLLGTRYARFGLTIADIEFLYDLQESLRGQRKVTGGAYEGPSEELRNTFNAISEAYYLPAEEVKRIDQRAIDDLFPRIPLAWFRGRDRALAAKGAFELTGAYQAAQRAMDTAESGYGAELIGAQYVGDLWEAARPESRVMGLVDTFEMTAPSAYLPVEVDFPEMLFVSESTTYNASNYATVKTGSQRVQVDAKKFVIHQMWSGEMDEDSIIPFVPFLRRQQQLSVAYYGDSLVLNGDTTNAATGNINLDDADPADTKHYLALDGLRHAGIVDNTANKSDLAGPITFAALLNARGRLRDATNKVDWGHPSDPNDLVYVADPDTADKIALLDEFITVDKMGQNATVLTGQQGRVGQHPLISSIALPKTEADGKVSNTAGNNTKGQVVDFNRRGFKIGWRRRVKTETERIPATDQTRIVSSLRLGLGRFTPTGAASGIEAADVIINIS